MILVKIFQVSTTTQVLIESLIIDKYARMIVKLHRKEPVSRGFGVQSSYTISDLLLVMSSFFKFQRRDGQQQRVSY